MNGYSTTENPDLVLKTRTPLPTSSSCVGIVLYSLRVTFLHLKLFESVVSHNKT